jgi:hypothetical protein
MVGSILNCLFSNKLIFGYTETRHIFAAFMNSRGKIFANISENKTNANKTSFTVQGQTCVDVFLVTTYDSSNTQGYKTENGNQSPISSMWLADMAIRYSRFETGF